MRLLPRERSRLELFLAAELARRRRGRGLRLTQAEAVAFISDELIEFARDGLPYAEVEQRGYEILGVDDVLEPVPALVRRVEVEALFADGSRLIVLRDPLTRSGPSRTSAEGPPVQWLRAEASLAATNEADVPIALSSHLHVFEANRRLRFDRRSAWGMRLAVAAGTKVMLQPGQTKELKLMPIAGNRIVRGHAGLVDGPLDAPGALETALTRAKEQGYLGA